jgi:hypothetical protein
MNKLSNYLIEELNNEINDYERYYRLKKEMEAYRAEKFLKT